MDIRRLTENLIAATVLADLDFGNELYAYG